MQIKKNNRKKKESERVRQTDAVWQNEGAQSWDDNIVLMGGKSFLE